MDIQLKVRYDLTIKMFERDAKTGERKGVITKKLFDMADFQFTPNGDFLWIVSPEGISKEKPGGMRKSGVWIKSEDIIDMDCQYRRDFKDKRDRQKYEVLESNKS